MEVLSSVPGDQVKVNRRPPEQDIKAGVPDTVTSAQPGVEAARTPNLSRLLHGAFWVTLSLEETADKQQVHKYIWRAVL